MRYTSSSARLEKPGNNWWDIPHHQLDCFAEANLIGSKNIKRAARCVLHTMHKKDSMLKSKGKAFSMKVQTMKINPPLNKRLLYRESISLLKSLLVQGQKKVRIRAYGSKPLELNEQWVFLSKSCHPKILHTHSLHARSCWNKSPPATKSV